MSLPTLLTLAHLSGLAFAVGAASVKVVLLLGSRRDPAFVATYLGVVRPITRLIVTGMILLTASGIGWTLLGYPLTPALIVKIVLVAVIWVLGPIIDNVAEPRFRRLAPAPGEAFSPAFLRARRLYMSLEFTATLLFYVIIVLKTLT